MEIKKFETYRDGGTIELDTDKGIFCFDERIGSNTKGRLNYYRYISGFYFNIEINFNYGK